MNKTKSPEWTSGVKLLSLLLAGLLWLSVALERTVETKVTVPVRLKHVPVGLRIDSPLPDKLEVTVSGPRILLCRLPFSDLSCGLDLTAATAGTARYLPQASSLGLHRELKVVRVDPESVSLTVRKAD